MAGRAVAIQLAALRKESGLSQKELTTRMGTSELQISCMGSLSYEGLNYGTWLNLLIYSYII
jgi:hypothetical protein